MRWISVFSLSLLLAVPQSGLAQATGTVTGLVTGTGGQPVAGASVAIAVPGTTRGDVTDAQGRYTITAVPAGSRTVRATFAGYSELQRTITVTAGQTVTLNLALTAQVIQLEEVVAVGYGTARRRDVTGSIGSVTAEDLTAEAAPVTAVSNALIGRTAGVQVVTNSAAPGSSASVQIRGVNSITASAQPLYVVDGIPLGSIPLNSLDPNNVESIQILKDASATAIYGARGANGVVLVTTKRGERGSNVLTVESSYGYQRPANFQRALNTQEFRQLTNEGLINAGRPPKFTPEQVNDQNAPYFDYPKAMLNDLEWQPQQNHAVTISGGDATSRYLLSGNFLEQKGIVIRTGFERMGGRVNLDRNVTSLFRVGANLSGNRTYTYGAGGNNGSTSAIQYDPAVPPYDTLTGLWNRNVVLNENFTNPYTSAVNTLNPRYATSIISSIYGEYDILEGLMLRSTFGGNFNFQRDKNFTPSFITADLLASASQESRERRELTNSTTLQYRRELGPGTLDALVGADIQTSRDENFTAQARNFPVDQLEYNNLGAGSTIDAPSSTITEWTLLSQLARVNYNLLERYLFTVTGRRDGSSRFGANNKWAVFPSAAFAWRVIDEPFMQNQAMLSDLKFRLSYGRTGNQAIDEYQSLARLNTTFIGTGTNTDVVTLVPADAAANPDLKWETQDQYNVGADIGFLDNRIALTVDAYQSNTSNLLLNRNLTWTTGFSTQLQNVGAVRNRGLEASLTSVNFEGDRFGWETTLNLSMNRNEVTELYGGLTQLSQGSGTQVGQPLGTFVGYKVLGIYQAGDECLVTVIPNSFTNECSPGEYKLQDTNGDKVVNDEDRVNLGNPQPDFYCGFTNNLRFGPVTLDAFFNFSVGNEVNYTASRYTRLVAGGSNEFAARSLRRWTPTNTNTDVPRANILRPNNRTYSTYILDGTFVRLQTLSARFDLPTRYIPGAEAASVMLTGQNLWLWDNYEGYDPENGGTDGGGYPRARIWNLGVNLTF